MCGSKKIPRLFGSENRRGILYQMERSFSGCMMAW